jgi:hypothetical protein
LRQAINFIRNRRIAITLETAEAKKFGRNGKVVIKESKNHLDQFFQAEPFVNHSLIYTVFSIREF